MLNWNDIFLQVGVICIFSLFVILIWILLLILCSLIFKIFDVC